MKNNNEPGFISNPDETLVEVVDEVMGVNIKDINAVRKSRQDIVDEIKKRYSKILKHIDGVILTLDGMDSDIPSSVVVKLLKNIVKSNSDQEIKTEISKLKNPVQRRLDNI